MASSPPLRVAVVGAGAFGRNHLRVYRELRGMTQQALADAAHVNRVQIADIEAGRNSGSVTTARKLADALQVAIDDLI